MLNGNRRQSFVPLQAVSLASADLDQAQNAGLRRFVHLEGGEYVRVDVTFSRYGARLAQTSTNKIGNGFFFKDSGMWTVRKTKLAFTDVLMTI